MENSLKKMDYFMVTGYRLPVARPLMWMLDHNQAAISLSPGNGYLVTGNLPCLLLTDTPVTDVKPYTHDKTYKENNKRCVFDQLRVKIYAGEF
jgi:hypothetical protein